MAVGHNWVLAGTLLNQHSGILMCPKTVPSETSFFVSCLEKSSRQRRIKHLRNAHKNKQASIICKRLEIINFPLLLRLKRRHVRTFFVSFILQRKLSFGVGAVEGDLVEIRDHISANIDINASL